MTDNKSSAKKGKVVEFKKIIRIANADLDGSKRVEHALIKIKGVSWALSHAIREVMGLPRDTLLSDLSKEQLDKIKEILESPAKFGIPSWLLNRRRDPVTGKDLHIYASDLVLTHKMDIRRLQNMRCYRGIRHMFNLKCRGQRTRSNGANVRGRKGGTVGVVRKKQQPAKKKK